MLVISCTRNACQVYVTCLLHFFLFISFHLFSFFTSPLIPCLFFFHVNVSFLAHFIPLPLSNLLLQFSLTSFLPLLSSTFHIPSDWFPSLSNFSSNAARAAFQPTASGAASLCALLMRLRAGKPRKSQVQGYPQHGLCRAWDPCGQHCSPCLIIW